MSNHYHLLIETGDATLSKGMRHVNGVYSQLFNKRHRREGHLLQGRFKAILVEKESYLLEVARYIVLNPVRARMVHSAEQWPWSSYRATAGLTDAHSCLTKEWILHAFGSRLNAACDAYKQFIADGNNQPSPWEKLSNQIYLGSDQFIEAVQRHIEPDRNLAEISRPQKLKPIKPLSYYQDTYPNLTQAMARTWQDGHYSQTKIGNHFHRSSSTVSRAITPSKPSMGNGRPDPEPRVFRSPDPAGT